jgi:hypothetical protein
MGRFHCVPLRNATRTHARRRFEPQTARAWTKGQRTCPDKSLSFDAELSSLNYEPGCIKVVDTFRREVEKLVRDHSPEKNDLRLRMVLTSPDDPALNHVVERTIPLG